MMEINRENYFRLLGELESLRSHPEDFDYKEPRNLKKGCIDCICGRIMEEEMSGSTGHKIGLFLTIEYEDALWLWNPALGWKELAGDYPYHRTIESLEFAITKLKFIGKKYGISAFQPNETAFLTELKDSLELVEK